MASEITLFHFDDDKPSIEDLAHPNGGTYWNEDELRAAMGYTDQNAFRKVIMRAMQACLSLNIMPDDNFVREDGSYKLTRFACYLVAMNGDTKKPQVAAAQVYFAALASTYTTHLEHADGIDRLVIRDEVRDGEKSLASTAKRHGVAGTGYGLFKDAGYRGMYNMSLKELKRFKGLKGNVTIADHMGRAELAAHLFRITQTEARIEQKGISGQRLLEQAAKSVGASVRQLVIQNTGSTPEKLPPAEPIGQVKKKIKGTSRNFKKLDD
jgi:DNA-damage-inducible protein D